MNKRTLMHRNQELVDFEVEPATGEAHVVDFVADDERAGSLGLTRQNGDWFFVQARREACHLATA